MIKRNINNIGQPLVTANGILLSGINISFTLAKGNTPASTFDAITKEKIVSIPNVVTTDENGEFSIDLWCTSRGVDVLEYVCAVDIMGVLPFRAPLGEGNVPLKWADFKASGATLLPTELDAFTLHLQDNARHMSPELAASIANIVATIDTTGNGNQFLSDDGTYKTIQHGIGIHTELPIISNGNGSITLQDNIANFYVSEGTEKVVKSFPITGGIVWLTDQKANFIFVDHQTNTFIATTDGSIVDYDRYLPYAQCFRNGNNIHVQMCPMLALGEIEHNFRRISSTERYAREQGVDALSVNNALEVRCNGGFIWVDSRRYTILPITAATRGFFCRHVNGNWVTTSTLNPKINNTDYDDGLNLAPLTDGFWTINYIFRGIEDQDHCYIVLEDEEYGSMELAQAHNGIVPLPDIISSHAMLIGRAIVQKGAASSILVESMFEEKFLGATSITNHSQLDGLDYAASGHTGFAKSNIVTEAASPQEEAAAFAAGAMIVIRTDLL